MPITIRHPEYEKYAARWAEMDDALDEQDTIRAKGEKYLPATSGMLAESARGTTLYDRYKGRARFYGITRQALTGIVGLMFEKDPDGATDDVLTKSGQASIALARDVARDVAAYGRSVLLVDAPKAGGDPFVVRYHPAALTNWKSDADNPGRFSMATFLEQWPEDDPKDEFEHKTVDRYLCYRARPEGVSITVYDKDGNVIEDERALDCESLGVFAIGSISVDPPCDPVPLMPVKDCAIAAYQISADLRQDLYASGQKQAWMAGCTQEQYKKNIEKGYGAGSCWYLGSGTEGSAGLIESTGSAYASAAQERAHEMDQAASYAVKMVQRSENAESGRALQIRAAAQHASIYTMADSISIGLTQAMQFRARWAGLSEPEPFAIRTEFTNEEAVDQIINALNSAINSGNMARSPLFESVRRAGLTDKTDEELQDEIDNQSIVAL